MVFTEVERRRSWSKEEDAELCAANSAQDIQEEMSTGQLNGPACSSEQRSWLKTDLCVVALPDPKTCTLNQKAYFTLSFTLVCSIAIATLCGQGTFNHLTVIFIAHV